MTADSRAFRLALLTSAAVAVSSCGGGSSSSSSPAPPPAGANVAAMVVDAGPVVNGAPTGKTNQGYVTVSICVPGTSNCQSIDHVWVDTGSSGLRLFASTFTSQLPASTQNGNPVANCVQFGSTDYIWGAVRMADVKISSESASAVPIHVIGDGGVTATAPSTCNSGGTNQNTVTLLGANGLLGIGVFRQDCGPGCETNVPAPPGFYYTCPAGSCTPVNMAVSAQLQNVVGLFAADNNGTLIKLPAISASGQTTASGSLIFGIGTQPNNPLGSATVFAVHPDGVPCTGRFTECVGFIQTTTTYGDMSEPGSYIDSGSNGLYFNDNITACTTIMGFYCPSSPMTLSATMLPYNSPSNTASHTYMFNIAKAESLTGNAFNNAGGPSGTCDNVTNPCTFDWGLPFFYGRSVFTALEGVTVSGNTGPFFAATP